MSNKLTWTQIEAAAAKVRTLIESGEEMKADGEMKRAELFIRAAVEGTIRTDDKKACKADADKFVALTDPKSNQLTQLSSYVRSFIKPEVLAAKINYRKLLADFRSAVPATDRPKRSDWQYACQLNTAVADKKPAAVDVDFLKAVFPKPLSAKEKAEQAAAALTPTDKRAAQRAEWDNAVDAIFAAAQTLAGSKKYLDAGREKAVGEILKAFSAKTEGWE